MYTYTAHKKIQAGFTLLELLVVVGIIAVVSGFAIPSFSSYIRNQNLRTSQDQVKNDLRKIQNRALSGVLYGSMTPPATHWGVRFTSGSNTYTYFTVNSLTSPSTACTSGSANSEASSAFPSTVVARNSGCVFFDYAKGNATTTLAGQTVYVGYSGATGTQCLSITLNAVGLITTSNNFVACP